MKLLQSILLANSLANGERFERDSDHASVSKQTIIIDLWS